MGLTDERAELREVDLPGTVLEEGGGVRAAGKRSWNKQASQGKILALSRAICSTERESSLLTTYWSGSTDVFGVPASRHGSLNPLFQVASQRSFKASQVSRPRQRQSHDHLPVKLTTRDPSWGHPRCGLGAVGAVLEPFCGHLSLEIDKVSCKLTFEIHPRRTLGRGKELELDMIDGVIGQHLSRTPSA